MRKGIIFVITGFCLLWLNISLFSQSNIRYGVNTGSTGGETSHFGYHAGSFINSNSCTSFGAYAGKNDSDKVRGTYIGTYAKYSSNHSLSAPSKTCIGDSAGYYLKYANADVLIGKNAGFYLGDTNYKCERNVFCGNNSGYFMHKGSYNFLAGNYAGYEAGKNYDICTGNIYIGYKSGYSNTKGSYNIFIGSNAGENQDSTDNTLIINNSSSDTSLLICGDFTGRNTGIGIKNPSEVLHVNGSLKLGGQNFGDDYFIYFGDDNWKIGIDDNSNDNLIFQVNDAAGKGFLFKNSNNVNLFRLAGNTGIAGTGTGSPSGFFDIQADTGALLCLNSTGTANGYLRFEDDGSNTGNIYQTNDSNKLHLQAVGALYMDAGAGSNGDLYFTSDGKIGIGVTNPGYMLSVDGFITCRGIKIHDIGADYVFEDDYYLMPLQQLADYIKKHKHLPGIPPAEETKEGVRLGAFNTLLLEKIEELTLYKIEQAKAVELLEKQNEIIRERISALE